MQKLLLQKKTDVEVYEMAEDEIRAYAASGNLLTRQVPMGSRDPLQLISRGSKEITAM